MPTTMTPPPRAPGPPGRTSGIDREDRRIYLAVAGLALVLLIGGGVLLFSHHSAPPAPPPPPAPPVATSANRTWKYSDTYYAGQLQEDAPRFRLPAPTVAEMEAVFPDRVEFTGNRALRPQGDRVMTAHLILTTSVRRAQIGGAVSVLRIQNRTDGPIAYLVQTSVGDPSMCLDKPAFQQNAIALAAHEVIERTECEATRNEDLRLRRVEVIEIPRLSYYYLSELTPANIGLDVRSSSGHTPPAGARTCQVVPAAVITGALRGGQATWRDVIDFYARHTCEEYTFFPGYRAPDATLTTLPAVPPGGQ